MANTAGELMLQALHERGRMTVEELTPVSGRDPRTAFSRLRVLANEEGAVALVDGKGLESSWEITDAGRAWLERKRAKATAKVAKLEADAAASNVEREEARRQQAPTGLNAALGGGVLRTWKPTHDGLDPLDPTTEPARRGDRLLIRYPEAWRPDAFVQLVADPRSDGIARAWNFRDNGFCHVDAIGFAARGWHVSRVRTRAQAESFLELGEELPS